MNFHNKTTNTWYQGRPTSGMALVAIDCKTYLSGLGVVVLMNNSFKYLFI